MHVRGAQLEVVGLDASKPQSRDISSHWMQGLFAVGLLNCVHRTLELRPRGVNGLSILWQRSILISHRPFCFFISRWRAPAKQEDPSKGQSGENDGRNMHGAGPAMRWQKKTAPFDRAVFRTFPYWRRSEALT